MFKVRNRDRPVKRLVLESFYMQASFLLASASPRRSEMLGWLGLPFRKKGAGIDESRRSSESPADYVLRVAREKALEGAKASLHNEWVLAADTIVVFEDQILGKPLDAADAGRMLRLLGGKTHSVLTAMALLPPGAEKPLEDICRARVLMRSFSDIELEDYLASRDPLDKAGAYAIQNSAFHPVENFKDCFACVVGLPLCHLVRLIRDAKGPCISDVPSICRQHFCYVCPVSQQILNRQRL